MEKGTDGWLGMNHKESRCWMEKDENEGGGGTRFKFQEKNKTNKIYIACRLLHSWDVK